MMPCCWVDKKECKLFESMRKRSAAGRLIEEQLYERVISELLRGEKRAGIWGKAIADSAGQEEKAEALYIKYRVQSLKDESEF